MRYVLLTEDSTNAKAYLRRGEADSLAEVVKLREEIPQRTLIAEFLDPVEVYAEVDAARRIKAPLVERLGAETPKTSAPRTLGALTEKERELLTKGARVVDEGPGLLVARQDIGKYEAREVIAGEDGE